MKKILVSMLTAMLLLPGMSVFAQNVARVGTIEYATIAEAIDAWKTNGGTLTLLGDCAYESALFSVTKKDTLNLNGHTLSWTATAEAAKAIEVSGTGKLFITGNGAANSVLSFDCKKSGAYAISASGSTNTLRIEKATVSAKASGGSGYVVNINHASIPFSITDAAIEMGDYMQRGVYMQGRSTDEKGVFSNVSITYTGSVPATSVYAIYTRRPGTYENLIIDLSKVPADKRCYGMYIYSGSKSVQTISGSNTSFTLNAKANSLAFDISQSINFTIESGVFTVPNMLDMNSSSLTTVAPNVKITGGKFSAPLPYNAQLPAGKILQKGSDGYYTLTDGAYKYVIVGLSSGSTSSAPGYYEGWVDASACWDKCSSDAQTYTMVRVLTTTDDIVVPTGKYVRLQKTSKDAAMGTITNNGNLVLQGTNPATKDKTETVWNNKIINNGTLTLSVAGTSTYGDAFVLENNGGSVLFGNKSQFTAKALEQVKAYIPEGYSARLNGDYYLVMENDASFVATVGGIGYDNLKAALAASTKDNPAKLCNDLTLSGNGNTTTGSGVHLSVPSKAENPHCYLDMNGHNIIADNSNDVYLWNNNSSYFTITGTGTIQAKGNDYGATKCMITLQGASVDKEDVSVLEIGENVTIDNENYGYVIGIEDALGVTYGVRVDIAGKIKSSRHFASTVGTLTNTQGNVPVINILPTAEITVGGMGIYAAGYAKWNFAGKLTADSCGIEIRAGEFTMTGGRIEATMTSPADDQFNGNGSTSQACAIAASQHSTKLPISVIINGGELKAYTPIYQANSQNNPQEAIDKVSVVVNNAKVYSTSKNIVWSANKKVVLNGGVYNLAPTAYAAEGKTVVANTDPDTKDMYPYTIGEVAQDITFATAGTWNTASNWSTGAVATSAVPVKIAADVTIPAGTTAEAYGITVEAGKVITIEDGGVLMVGKNGIAGITNANQLIIKDGGALLISPVAEASVAHPLCTNELKTTVRDAKEEYNNRDATYEYIWKNIASPVQKDGMAFTPKGQSAVNIWNNGWEYITSAAEFGVPFTGYHITVHPNVAATVASPTYEFTGNSNGNDDITLTMNREGFHLFGNSWSAPLDVREILNQIEHFTDSKVNTSIKVYISDKCTLGGKNYFDGQYVDITRASLSSNAAFAEAFSTLGAHECFFLCSNASNSQVSLNYEKAVWNAMLSSAKSSAPRRMVAADEPTYTTRVVINLTAENGRPDDIMLLNDNSEWSKKLMNEGPANVNIYVATAENNYSQVSAADLTGTELTISTNKCERYTLSFSSVMGEPLYIKDMQTGVVTEMSEGNTYTFTAVPYTTSTRFRIVSRSEVTTGIDTIVPVAGKSGVYTLMGQYLGETSVWETLPAGVYIVNGTKVVK